MTSVTQTVFSLLWLLYSYERGDELTIDLLESSAIVFIPIVNVDGVAQIGEWYENSGELYEVRKNRRYIESSMKRCSSEELGVDLNRNYGFRFKYDDKGSSSEACEPDYRGTAAFSEPETQAMQTLVYDLKNVKIALNLLAQQGEPVWIHPFSYTADASNGLLADSYAQAEKFYSEVASSQQLEQEYGYLVGNSVKTTKNTANGEVSDWMLAELGIFAVSVRLGRKGITETEFYISDAEDLRDTVVVNNEWIQGMLRYLKPDFSCVSEGPPLVINDNPEDPATVKILTAFICENRSLVSSLASDYVFKMSEEAIGQDTRSILFILAGDDSKTDLDFECDESVGTCPFEMPSIQAQSKAEIKLISDVPVALTTSGASIFTLQKMSTQSQSD